MSSGFKLTIAQELGLDGLSSDPQNSDKLNLLNRLRRIAFG